MHGVNLRYNFKSSLRRYAANPEFLRQEIEAQRRPAPEDQIVIDELQKVY